MSEQNFQNTLYTNDNLFILNGLNSNLVDLIYLDPPFNSKRLYSTPIGKKQAKASFKDMWNWQDVNEAYLETLSEKYPALTNYIATIGAVNGKNMMAYITYMTQRIIEMYRILKDAGSFYLHCDTVASHYLKFVLDEIFGKNNFRNEIIWKRGTMKGAKAVGKQYGRNHDVILYYSKSKNYTYNRQHIEYSEDYVRQRYKNPDNDLKGLWTDNPIGTRSPESIEKLRAEGRIFKTAGNTERIKFYLSEMKGIAMDDVWLDIDPVNTMAKDNKYPTQKPLPLLYRIIKTSSNEGDIVLDPFCGCATTCVAAQQLNRKWIGIDIEKQAVSLLKDRLSDDAGMFSDFVNILTIPQRTDIQIVEPTKSVKERLYKQQNCLCNGCNTEFGIYNLEIDHIIPRAKGGGDYYENYQLLCGNCNRMKGDRPMEYLRMKIKAREEMLNKKFIFGE
ncbi:MAG: HNH endonuclease [Prevotellaceae bacterium]|jgi:site-specific DNA-methyltransferase (adenine-specific)|nr:HNH endonuclease [Prevotellaceae bacterium]